VTLVSVHAPTEERSGEQKKEFYDILGRTCERAQKYEYLSFLVTLMQE
jgi:hypothetical protein